MVYVLFYQQTGCLPDYTAVCDDGDLTSFVRIQLDLFFHFFEEYTDGCNFTDDEVDQFVDTLIRDGFLTSPIHPLSYFSLVAMSEEDALVED